MFKLYNVITPRHLDMMGKLMLVTSSIIAYSYICELFLAWWSGDRYEMFEQLHERPFGFYAVGFWIMISCNCLITQLLWSRADPAQRGGAVRHRRVRQRRHVARAVRDHRRVADARLPAVVVAQYVPTYVDSAS